MNSQKPFDMTEFMSMFQPENIAKMFDVEKMRAAFDPSQFQGLDMQALVQSNQRNYAAMVAANQAAVTAYQTYCEMQQRIYQDIMRGAMESIQAMRSGSPAEAAQKQSEIYASAMEKSLSIMTELAAITKQANEEAYEVIQGRVEEAVKALKKKK